MRINRETKDKIEQLNGITLTKKSLASELRAVIDTVKRLDFENKEVQNDILTKEHAYDEKMADVTG